MSDAFRSWSLPAAAPPFEELLGSVRFDDVTAGRRGTVIVRVGPSGIPIVRTTTPYPAPAQPFRDVHERLAQEITARASLANPLNNALVEHYTRAYAKMKRHSDQALDLAEASAIAIYSCYRDPRSPSRRLTVRSKESGASFDVPLDHGSVVTFSVGDNRRFTHAIALRAHAPDNDWLGITFRTSKTLIRLQDGHATLPGGERLTLADAEQRRELFQMKRQENDSVDFTWPSISYTLSESDLLPPEPMTQ